MGPRRQKGDWLRDTIEAAETMRLASRSPLQSATTKQFRKDYKRCVRQGRNLSHLAEVMRDLIGQKPLAASCKTHALKGEWKDHEECHLGGDFLLIWRVSSDTITFVRVGNHQELFGR